MKDEFGVAYKKFTPLTKDGEEGYLMIEDNYSKWISKKEFYTRYVG